MRRLILLVVGALATAAIAAPAAWAGSPHFVGNATASASGNTLSVSAKEAGLGDEAQIVAVLTADALCINGGGNHPKAVNKTSVSQTSTEPVQNGQATYTISATATFQPSCSPPMTVEFTNIKLVDTTNNLTATVVPSTVP